MDICVFSGCKELAEIEIPEKIKEIPDLTFDQCIKLNTVSFKEGLEIIGSFSFRNCCSLSRVSIPRSVKKIDTSAFEGCRALKTVEILGENVFEGAPFSMLPGVNIIAPLMWKLRYKKKNKI